MLQLRQQYTQLMWLPQPQSQWQNRSFSCQVPQPSLVVSVEYQNLLMINTIHWFYHFQSVLSELTLTILLSRRMYVFHSSLAVFSWWDKVFESKEVATNSIPGSHCTNYGRPTLRILVERNRLPDQLPSRCVDRRSLGRPRHLSQHATGNLLPVSRATCTNCTIFIFKNKCFVIMHAKDTPTVVKTYEPSIEIFLIEKWTDSLAVYRIDGTVVGSRNVTFEFYTSQRLERPTDLYHWTATFFENQPGVVLFRYLEISQLYFNGHPRLGSTTVVGAQRWSTSKSLTFSYRQPLLHAGLFVKLDTIAETISSGEFDLTY